MSVMKNNKKQGRLHTEKINQKPILIYSRGQTAELKQTANRQCTEALAECVPEWGAFHSRHPATNTTSQELHSARAQGNRQGRKKFLLLKTT